MSPTHWLHYELVPDQSWLRRIDPRARILALVATAGVVAILQKNSSLLAALMGTVILAVGAGGRPKALLARLLPFNLLAILLALMVPIGVSGEPICRCGPLVWSRAGLELVGQIALKGNAILLAVFLLGGTMELASLAHALDHLGVPSKLAQLLIFTVRYLEVVDREYHRLRASMKVRGFQPALNGHSLRTYGTLVGMLLVRAWDRSERVLAAMQCRGFTGQFWLLDHFRYQWTDAWFGLGWSAALAVLIALELSG